MAANPAPNKVGNTTQPVPIQYVSEPMSGEDLPGYIMDELNGFVEYHEITIDSMGYVQGTLTPQDALMLAYKFIAWKVLSDELEKSK